MAVTKMENMVNPQVMGDMIDAKVEAQLKITPYAKLDTSLQGVPGDTKTVPSWNYIGDADDVAEGDEVDVSQMTSSTTTFTIKKAMKAVGITQEAINSGLGDPVGQAPSLQKPLQARWTVMFWTRFMKAPPLWRPIPWRLLPTTALWMQSPSLRTKRTASKR